MPVRSRDGVQEAVTAGCGAVVGSGECCGQWARANGRCERHGGGASRYSGRKASYASRGRRGTYWTSLLWSLVVAWRILG